MKLPAKVNYACRAVLELAVRYNGEMPVQMAIVSKAQNISKGFLTQLFIRLRTAGIVKSARGVEGGYFLARRPSQISLADIFRAIDDSIIEIPKAAIQGSINYNKLITGIWNEISSDVVKRLEGISLESLVIKLKSEQPVYFI